MNLSFIELRDYLDSMVHRYNGPEFILGDPISVPHRYRQKEDIEIAGFLAASIAWGNRKTITNNAEKMVQLMNDTPFEFVMHASDRDMEKLNSFVHRTFNGMDFTYFVKSLRNIYTSHGGLETIFKSNQTKDSLQDAIHVLHQLFFELPVEQRTRKHVADPHKGSVAKRINMFLRWMIRKDGRGVDFGLWDIPPSKLSCPLDVHSGNVARKLGLIHRKQNDQKALKELDAQLRLLDPKDPVKYDFALFGLGIFEGFK
jgi:uncharacterized protein (TIGR02757 family)